MRTETKTGMFGGMFGADKKRNKKIQELEEAKRLQEKLIREQMKALALDNEVEELEREKEMQNQLIQEAVDKKIADASTGSSSLENNQPKPEKKQAGITYTANTITSTENSSIPQHDSSLSSSSSSSSSPTSSEISSNGDPLYPPNPKSLLPPLTSSKEDGNSDSVSTYVEEKSTHSEKLGLESEPDTSDISDGGDSYVQELINQRKYYDNERQEDCCEEAYKVFKNTIETKETFENGDKIDERKQELQKDADSLKEKTKNNVVTRPDEGKLVSISSTDTDEKQNVEDLLWTKEIENVGEEIKHLPEKDINDAIINENTGKASVERSWGTGTKTEDIKTEKTIDTIESIERSTEDVFCDKNPCLPAEASHKYNEGGNNRRQDYEVIQHDQLGANKETVDKCEDGNVLKDAGSSIPPNMEFAGNIQYNKLMQRRNDGKSLEDDEEYELALLQRLKQGEFLSDSEVGELKMLRQIREQLDKNIATFDILRKEKESYYTFDYKQYGVLIDKMRNKVALHENEFYELALLERIKQGENLREDELGELKMLKQIREQLDWNVLAMENLRQENEGRLVKNSTSIMEQPPTVAVNNTVSEPECKIQLNRTQVNGQNTKNESHEEIRQKQRDKDIKTVGLDQPRKISDVVLDDETRCFREQEAFNLQLMQNVDTTEANIEENEEKNHNINLIVSEEEIFEKRHQQKFNLFDTVSDTKTYCSNNRSAESLGRRKCFDTSGALKTESREVISKGEAVFESNNLKHIWKEEDARADKILDKDDVNSHSESSNKESQYEADDDLNKLPRIRCHDNFIDDNIDGQSDEINKLTVDDEDSVCRRNLLERQMAGKRLNKKEFQWLQILIKKSRNEELFENDVVELEIMRNQKKESRSPEKEFVNTKVLLEEEIRKKAKRELKERRRKEKEKRLEQQQKRKEQKKSAKKIKRKKRSDNEGDLDIRIFNGAGSRQFGKEKQPGVLHPPVDTAQTVQIIGSPSMQISESNDDEKDETKTGMFGGMFGADKKRNKKIQELEEVKRLQEKLIREQMKALALDNEVEELEREKVMQNQLIQEAVDKKIADASTGSSSWEADTEFQQSEDDSSSLSSLHSSFSDSSSEPGDYSERNENTIFQNINDQNEKYDEYWQASEAHENANLKNLYSASSIHNGIKPVSGQSSGIRKPCESNKKDEIPKQSGNVKNRNIPLKLGTHLKKQKKRGVNRKTKYGDDVSLGTLQLSKMMKDDKSQKNRHVKTYPDNAGKLQERPWVKESPTVQKKMNKNEKSGNSVLPDDPLNFSHSFVSRISEANSEVEEESMADLISSKKEGGFMTDKIEHSDAENSLNGSASFTSLGEEVYDLGLHEYNNIESRLAEKLGSKTEMFDTTWENVVADENVVAQINQRLRERQRMKENTKEKKKQEKKKEEGSRDFPRLFLFEGEKVDTKLKKKRRKKKKKKINGQKKLDKTLTKEFRKAMQQVFYSDSDTDKRHKNLIGTNFDDDADDDHIDRTTNKIQSFDGTVIFDESERSISENDALVEDSDEESEKFVGGYLQRLQVRLCLKY